MQRELLNEKMRTADIDKKDIAKKMGIYESTLYRKLKNGNFSIKEARKMKCLLKLSDEEAIHIFLN